MKQYLLAVAIATLALAACKRDAEPAPEPAVVAPAQTTAPTDSAAIADVTATSSDQTSPADAAVAFDTKGFAGKFAATGTNLEVGADGTYRLSVHAESANADLTTDGTWTVEADGKHILLDPSSKAEADRRYEIVSHDELRAVDGSQSLSREGAGK